MIYLEIKVADILNSLGAASVVIPILQLLIAGIPSALKRWFIEKSDYSKRVNFIIEKHIEGLSSLLYQIFDRGLNTSINLRGQLPEHVDLLYPYQKKMQLYHTKISKLNKLHKSYKALNRFLLQIAIVGIVLSVLVFIKPLTTYILCASLTLIIVELFIIAQMYYKVEVLEDYEYELNN